MGTDVHVIAVGGPVSLVELARDLIEDLEARWSRFRPTSEVSFLNLRAGRPVRLSPETITLLERAVEGARLTGGRFDPTVLGDVVRAGYDRSFELLPEGASAGRSELRSGWREIVIDPGSGTAMLPEGVGFDPGGVGKGLAADLVLERLLGEGAAGACVNVGGDLRVEGQPRRGDAWAIDVAHPLRPRAHTLLGFRSGAVATSTRTRRAWGPERDRRHHLIDPATGRPARTGLASATVVASRGWQAEVFAKGAFVAGLSEGLVLLARAGVEGVLVGDDGSAYPSAGLDRFIQPTRWERSRLVGADV